MSKMFEAEAIGLCGSYETRTIHVPKPFKVVENYKDFAFLDCARVGRALALYEVGDREEAIVEMDVSISLKGYPGLGATMNVAKPRKGQTVAIFGLGAVGLTLLKVQGFVGLLLVGIPEDLKEVAKKFGITEFVNPKYYNKHVQEVGASTNYWPFAFLLLSILENTYQGRAKKASRALTKCIRAFEATLFERGSNVQSKQPKTIKSIMMALKEGKVRENGSPMRGSHTKAVGGLTQKNNVRHHPKF